MIYIGAFDILNLYVSESTAVNLVFTVTTDPSILSILGARLMLNLKIEGKRNLQQGTNHRVKSTVLGIEFVAPSSDTDGSLGEAMTEMRRPEMVEMEEIPA